MIFSEPRHSRETVNESGEYLVSVDSADKEPNYDKLNEAINIIDNWRTSHAFPLRTIRYGIERNAKRIVPNSITVQRLKRLFSIDLKLRKYRNLKLSEIQDIGGCRAVVNTVSEVQMVVDAYKNSEIRHVLDDEDDYIKKPKKSGYRSHHLIYRYQSDRNTIYNNLKVEIQIRTRLQHAWATSVETVGRFIGQPLKSSIAKDEGEHWLRFFALMGTAIANREGCPPCPHTPKTSDALKQELRDYAKRLDVENRLNAYKATITVSKDTKVKGARLFLLVLDSVTKALEIKGYQKHEAEKAFLEYKRIETSFPQKAGKDVVLVEGDSLKQIIQAYPNYHRDTSVFLDILKASIQ
jgi:hypothetical protein